MFILINDGFAIKIKLKYIMYHLLTNLLHHFRMVDDEILYNVI